MSANWPHLPCGARRWLYFNTEAFTSQPGHAQLARLDTSNASAPDATAERLLESGTVGHPADLAVDAVLVSTSDWAAPLHTWPVFGGQGTLNVNSWSPDSTRFAYIAYPLDIFPTT